MGLVLSHILAPGWGMDVRSECPQKGRHQEKKCPSESSARFGRAVILGGDGGESTPTYYQSRRHHGNASDLVYAKYGQWQFGSDLRALDLRSKPETVAASEPTRSKSGAQLEVDIPTAVISIERAPWYSVTRQTRDLLRFSRQREQPEAGPSAVCGAWPSKGPLARAEPGPTPPCSYCWQSWRRRCLT